MPGANGTLTIATFIKRPQTHFSSDDYRYFERIRAAFGNFREDGRLASGVDESTFKSANQP